jgi:hypothetical protein
MNLARICGLSILELRHACLLNELIEMMSHIVSIGDSLKIATGSLLPLGGRLQAFKCVRGVNFDPCCNARRSL